MAGQHQSTVYMEQGGDKQVVESGGEIELQSGAILDIQSGAQVAVASGGKFGRICGVTFTIGAEAANAINVGLQLTDANGDDLDEIGTVFAFLSAASTGIGVAGTAPDTSVAIGTDGAILKEHTTKLVWTLQSESDGDIDITITDTTTGTWYLAVVLPSGQTVVSDAITFA